MDIYLIDEICFSMDTDVEEINNSTRIGFDSSILYKIDSFHKQYPSISLTIKSTITKTSKDHIKSLINFSFRHSFNKITFGFCLPIGKCLDIELYKQLRGSSSELIKIQDYIIRMKRRYNLLIEIVEPCVVFGCKLINVDTTAFDLHIDENGFIYPCDGMNNAEYIVANISDDELENSIINNFENVKSMILMNNNKCTSCTIQKDCEGSCLLYGKSSNKHDADMFCEFRRLKVMQNNLRRSIIDD